MNYPKAILVSGSHRSGTTWVGKMISTSPSIAYINEPFNPFTYKKFRGRCGAKFVNQYTYITDENESEFYPYLKDTLEFRYNFLGQLKSSQNCADVRRAVKEQFQFWGYQYRSQTPLMKDPLALCSLPWLADKFNLDIVVLIRHPAAFVASVKRVGWKYNFSELLAQPPLIRDHLSEFEEEIREHATTQKDIIDNASLIWKLMYYMVSKYQKSHQHWLYRRYEDIAKEPVSAFESLFSQLNLDFSESVKNTIVDFTNNSNPTNFNDKDWSFRKRNSNANITSWKSKLTDEEIKRIRESVESVASNFYSDADW